MNKPIGFERRTEPAEPASGRTRKSPRALRFHDYLLKFSLSAGVALALCLLAEAALRLHGLGVPAKRFEIHGSGPDATVETVMAPPSSRLPTRMVPQTFQLRKPAGTFRVICYGGSTVYGYPYGPKGTFPNILQKILAAALPDRTVEVINAGFTGGDSARALELMHESVDYDADLWVVYSGHNEFLRYDFPNEYDITTGYNPRVTLTLRWQLDNLLTHSLLWRWVRGTSLGLRTVAITEALRGQDPRGHSGRLSPEREEMTYRSFEANLVEMAEFARERRTPLILCTVAGNMRSFGPMGSGPPPQLSESDRRTFLALTTRASERISSGDAAGAMETLREARALAGNEAQLHFLRGTALLEKGRIRKARAQLEVAVELDPLRHRAPARINETIRAVAAEEGVPLCDVQRAFEARSPDRIVGDELIVDNVHPAMAGLVLIAREIARTMVDAGVVPSGTAVSPGDDELIRATGMVEPDWRRATSRLALSAAGRGDRQQSARLFLKASTIFAPDEPSHDSEEKYLRGLSAYFGGSLDEARSLLDESKRLDPARYEALNRQFSQVPVEALLAK